MTSYHTQIHTKSPYLANTHNHGTHSPSTKSCKKSTNSPNKYKTASGTQQSQNPNGFHDQTLTPPPKTDPHPPTHPNSNPSPNPPSIQPPHKTNPNHNHPTMAGPPHPPIPSLIDPSIFTELKSKIEQESHVRQTLLDIVKELWEDVSQAQGMLSRIHYTPRRNCTSLAREIGVS